MKKSVTQIRELFDSLPDDRRKMMASVWLAIRDMNNGLDAFAIVSRCKPDETPPDIEHFRVAKSRLLALAVEVSSGSIGSQKFHDEYREIMTRAATEEFAAEGPG